MSTPAGKPLKELFDAGSDKLKELEKDVSNRLEHTAKTHVDSRRNGENGSVARVEEKATDLDNELRTYMASSIERLQKMMESELKETDEHLTAVKFDLSMLSDKLKHSILELRQSHEENVDNLCLSLSENYEGAVENGTVEMQKQDFNCSKHVRSHGTVVMNSLQQRLDHSLWESRGEEKQYNSALFKAFMQKANSIDTHFSGLMQKLSADFQGHFKIVENKMQEGEPELSNAAQALAIELDIHAKEIEVEIHELFRTTVDEHSKKLDSNLSSVAQDLSSVHDSTTERLSEQTKQLSAGLVTASGEARETLSIKCANLRTEVDTMMDSFRTRLDEKLKNTQTLRETLQAEKETIFEEIRKELSEVREGFEKRLTRLMAEATERVTSISSEAESDITDAYKRCETQVRNDGLATKTEIEQAVTEFLEMLAEQRRKALDEIDKSAGGDTAAESADKESKPAEPGKPTRRTPRKKEESSSDFE